MYQRTGQKGSGYSPDTNHAAEQETDDNKKYVAGNSDKTELDPGKLVRNHNGDQIVGAGSGFTVDNDGHADGQDDTAKCHDNGADDERTVFVYKRRNEPVEEIDDRTSAKCTDDSSGFDIALCCKLHNDHDQAQDYHMYRSDGGETCACYLLTGQGQPLNKHGKGVCAHGGDQKHGDAQMCDDKTEE